MQFGISIPNNQGVESARTLADLAAEAEAEGYGSVWVSEHLFHASYVDKRLGNRPYHEALTVLTACAMRTERALLGTSVLVLPWHHPARLAKTLATIDDLSAGRVVLGIGVATTEDEFQALGVPFRQRGRIANEMLDAMKTLWRDEYPEHHGRYHDFQGLRFSPKPVQKPGIPIWVGGNSDAAIERIVRHGDGWHPLRQSPEEVAQKRALILQRARAAGRSDLETLPIAVRLAVAFKHHAWDRPVEQRRAALGSAAEMRALVDAYAAAGVTHVIVDSGLGNPAEIRAVHRRFIDEVAR